MERWLARLRHDLVKHAAWRGRDLASVLDEGGSPRPGEVAALRRLLRELPDGEGRAVGLLGAFRVLGADFDDELPGEVAEAAREALGAALAGFEAALVAVEAEVAAETGEGTEAARRVCAALGSLEQAFDRLAHDVKSALRS